MNPIPEWEKELEKILGEEMQGILLMNSTRRFDMCERLMDGEGKLAVFIRSLLSSLSDQWVECVEEQKYANHNPNKDCHCVECDSFAEILKRAEKRGLYKKHNA